MIIFDQITEANRIEHLENLLKVTQTTLESVTEQRDRLAEAIRKHRDELELTSGDSVDRILWHALEAVEGGSDE
jgi:hypothetical protein